MATQPTQNQVPSESPRDLKFNAGKFDEFVTSPEHTYTDRFGNQHWTISGIEYTALQAIERFGYITLDSFEIGNTLTLPNQVLRLEATGEYYRWDGDFADEGKVIPPGSTPETTGGVGIGAWLSVGDATLRSNLSSSDGAMYVNGVSIQFSSLNQALSYSNFKNGKRVDILGYNYPGDGGESSFVVTGVDDPVGVLTNDGSFRLKRISGHDYLERIIRNGATPKVIAHRGWSGITINEWQGNLTSPVYFVPENTRAAIRFSAERGAFGVEGDTKISSDGIPVIFHDETVDRTTNGTGTVSSKTFSTLKSLDAGSYVSGIYSDEKILNYDEWLRECKRRGVMPFAEWSTTMSSEQADAFLLSVRKYYGEKPRNVFLYSTYPQVLELVRAKNAYIGLGVIPSFGIEPTTEQLELAYRLGNCGISLSGSVVTNPTVIDTVKKYGLIMIYAIANSPSRIDNCISAGVDIMITDCYRG
ncbi:hypothetical protein LKL11_001062 [Escherichia coli]|nr:hypothetical protein [Escherichia coli]